MSRKTLDEILSEEDDLGLLNVKAPTVSAVSGDARVARDFEEICVFVDRHGFPPGEGPAAHVAGVTEKKLQIRLKSYRENSEVAALLAPSDRHGLLAGEADVAPASLDDILDSDDELLSRPSDDIFELRNARKAQPERKAERKPCKEFDRFKTLFDECAADLASGRRKSLPFAREQEINAGDFFILNGLMAYVAEVRDPHIRNGRKNARLRIIFDNGTEGENLLRSLATELYKDPNGRRISDPESGPLFGTAPSTVSVASPTDRVTGCIYVVRSLSPLPEIKRLDGSLFKIGFTTGRFEDRVRAAAEDPTFLMAPVHPVRTYDAVNMDAGKFETLIHRFFAAARLDIEIKDRFGKPYRPQEWFLLPLPVIEQAIRMLEDGTILRHRYDPKTVRIVPVK